MIASVDGTYVWDTTTQQWLDMAQWCIRCGVVEVHGTAYCNGCIDDIQRDVEQQLVDDECLMIIAKELAI